MQSKIPKGMSGNKRYKYYMYANLLKEGDYHRKYGYRLWLSERLSEFRNVEGLERFDSLDFHGLQDKFDDYLREYAEKARMELKGQSNIFDFLGGENEN